MKIAAENMNIADARRTQTVYLSATSRIFTMKSNIVLRNTRKPWPTSLHPHQMRQGMSYLHSVFFAGGMGS